MNLKEKNTQLNFIRLSLSPYQSKNFTELEKKALESLDLNYFLKEEPKNTASHILITNSQTAIKDYPDSLIEQTKLLIHPNSGYDNLLEDPRITDAHFPVVLGNPIRAHAVSEYILGQLFELFSPAQHHPFWRAGRQWDRSLLKSQKVLLIGFGHIGQILNQVLAPLVHKMMIYDPFKGQCLDLDLALKEADIIIPVCSLNQTSHYLFNQEKIQMLKPGFTLINASRGKILDQVALQRRLKDEPQSFACLDVFEQEPFFDRLSSLENFKTTSHIAGVFKDLDQEIIHFTKRITQDFMELPPKDFSRKHASLLLKNRFSNGVFI